MNRISPTVFLLAHGLACAYIRAEPPPLPPLPPSRADDLATAKTQIVRWDEALRDAVAVFKAASPDVLVCFHPSQGILPKKAPIAHLFELDGDVVRGGIENGMAWRSYMIVKYELNRKTRMFRATVVKDHSTFGESAECGLRRWTPEHEIAAEAELSFRRWQKEVVIIAGGIVVVYKALTNADVRRCVRNELVSRGTQKLIKKFIKDDVAVAVLAELINQLVLDRKLDIAKLADTAAMEEITAMVELDPSTARFAPIFKEQGLLRCLLPS